MLTSDRQALDSLVTQYGYTFMQCVSDETSNYAYLSMNVDLVKAFSGYEVNLKDTTQRITAKVDYFALDEGNEILNYLEKNYDYDGVLQDMNNADKNYCIISETAANRKVLKVKPGDKIDIMVRTANTVKPKANTPEDYLSDLIAGGEQFEKKTFTVAAVLKNMPTGTNLPIFLNAEDFTDVTGSPVRYNQVSIYVTPNISNSEISDLHSELVKWADDFATVQWNDAVSANREKTEERNLPVIQTIALFALILSPLFWFFSQIMFFGKREEEFSMLRGMGATEKEIRKIFSQDGLAYAGLGVITTVVFSLIGVFAIHRFNMAFVARLNTEARVLYKFNFGLTVTNLDGDVLLNPLWIALAIAVVLTAICGYLSSMIPYIIDRNKARKTISKEFGE
jgi:ABC-type lipoprotein release transport system permease subunit